MKSYRNIFSSLTLSDVGLILKDEKILLPKSLWQVAVDKAHQGGHPGIRRMKTRIRSHFWIPSMNNLVKERVRRCHCQLFTPKTTTETIAPQKTAKHAWEEVSIDLFSPLPDKKHILVVQDNMSRFPAATRVQTTGAPPVIKALKNIYEAYYSRESSQDTQDDLLMAYRSMPHQQPHYHQEKSYLGMGTTQTFHANVSMRIRWRLQGRRTSYRRKKERQR